MKICLGFLALALAVLLRAEATEIGSECQTDADCDGNLDCTRVQFKKICVPVKCATLAAQAVLASGFDADSYISDIRSDAGLSLSAFKGGSGLRPEDSERLEKAMASSPPPIDEFMANYTACLHGDGHDPEERKLQAEDTFVGLQWSVSALFSYVGKSTWGTPPGGTVRLQRVENCIGALVGADVGLDVLFQIYQNGAAELAPGAITSSLQIPIATIGPIGVAISHWTNEFETLFDGNIFGTAIEVTFGPSLGVALGGGSYCFATVRQG